MAATGHTTTLVWRVLPVVALVALVLAVVVLAFGAALCANAVPHTTSAAANARKLFSTKVAPS